MNCRLPPTIRTAVKWLAVAGVALAFCGIAAALDEVVLTNGRSYLGTITSNTPTSVVLSIDGGTVEFPRSAIASPPYFGPAGAEGGAGEEAATPPGPQQPHPLPGIEDALHRLHAFSWGEHVRQVPVLVTDRGRWQYMPCVSFWVGDFCQLNFFGDPTRPAAIEVSLVRPAPEAWEQKRHLLEFMLGLAPALAMDSRFDHLNVHGDSFTVGDLWFAVTGPGSRETPGRWSVLLLHEISLSPARASMAELQAISEPVPLALLDPTQPRSWQRGSWTPDDLAWLRDVLALNHPELLHADPSAQPWTALGGERVFVRSFERERGRYTRSTNDWLSEIAASNSQ